MLYMDRLYGICIISQNCFLKSNIFNIENLGKTGIEYIIYKNIIYIQFLATLGLRCCAWAFSTCGERGLLFVAVHGLLIAVASVVSEHGLQARGLQQLWCAGSVVVACGLQSSGLVVMAHGLSSSMACGIFPDQSTNLCRLHWQADS